MKKLEYIPGDLVYYNGNIITIENSDGYYATYYDEDEFLQEINVNVIKGIIHEATRPSRDKNKPWKWKVLNKGYEYYGQNVQDPNYQSQTQIKWYDNRFCEFLKLVGVEVPQSFIC